MLKPIETRRSIRKYLDKSVDDSVLLSLIESARLAPSGSNKQPWHFIVVREAAARKEIARISHHQEWMLSAPVFIACVADMRSRVALEIPADVDENSPQMELKQIIRDTAIAVEHIVLEAAQQGLGTCWVAWFKQNEIRPLLNLAKDKYLLCILTVGYAAEDPKARTRKAMEEILHHEKW